MKILKNYKYDNEGFTLVEMLISVAFLGIIAVTFLPIFTFGLHSSTQGKSELEATKIATNQIEWLKMLDYNEELGLNKPGYKPHGLVDGNLYMNEPDSNLLDINGTKYKVKTKIYWDRSNTSIDNGEILTASKKVEVSVYSFNPFSKKEEKTVVLNTLISFEGERSPVENGIKVFVKWKVDEPKKNVLIKASGSQVYFAYTDSEGEAIIADKSLAKGSYNITPLEWDLGDMMVKPLGVMGKYPNQTWLQSNILEVPDDLNSKCSFTVDYPARIKISNKNIPKSLKITLEPLVDLNNFKLNLPFNKLEKANLWWDWDYNYEVVNENNNLERYFLTDLRTKQEWDGKFDQPENKVSCKELKLNFGILENETVFKKDEEIKTIGLKFTAPIKEINNPIFRINGINIDSSTGFYKCSTWDELLNLGKLETIKKGCWIEPEDSKIKIHIYDPENSLGIEKENKIKIINPENIKTAQDIELAPDKSEATFK